MEDQKKGRKDRRIKARKDRWHKDRRKEMEGWKKGQKDGVRE